MLRAKKELQSGMRMQGICFLCPSSMVHRALLTSTVGFAGKTKGFSDVHGFAFTTRLLDGRIKKGGACLILHGALEPTITVRNYVGAIALLSLSPRT